jgi:hypothetical protein
VEHAEQLALREVDTSQVRANDYTLIMVDQFPCEGKCVPRIRSYQTQIKGGVRIFVRVPVDQRTRIVSGSPKGVATAATKGGVETAELLEMQKLAETEVNSKGAGVRQHSRRFRRGFASTGLLAGLSGILIGFILQKALDSATRYAREQAFKANVEAMESAIQEALNARTEEVIKLLEENPQSVFVNITIETRGMESPTSLMLPSSAMVDSYIDTRFLYLRVSHSNVNEKPVKTDHWERGLGQVNYYSIIETYSKPLSFELEVGDEQRTAEIERGETGGEKPAAVDQMRRGVTVTYVTTQEAYLVRARKGEVDQRIRLANTPVMIMAELAGQANLIWNRVYVLSGPYQGEVGMIQKKYLRLVETHD